MVHPPDPGFAQILHFETSSWGLEIEKILARQAANVTVYTVSMVTRIRGPEVWLRPQWCLSDSSLVLEIELAPVGRRSVPQSCIVDLGGAGTWRRWSDPVPSRRERAQWLKVLGLT